MLEALNVHMPPDVRFTKPQGGMFVWVELPEGENARDLLVRCLPLKVAFVPGGAFYPNGGNEHTLRLNYSVTKETQIREGIKRLAQVIGNERTRRRA
jgi:DNA-binding transcriptional MocR family regulator